ncbi:MAG TPA: hypothetical protein VGF85_00870 [Opitutaceae bacterium]|jgi:uncharacterized membrane protein YozB (DUF420 family)
MTVDGLPAAEAILYGFATVVMRAGFAFIEKGGPRRHRACLLSAAGARALFLACHLTDRALIRGARRNRWHPGRLRLHPLGPHSLAALIAFPGPANLLPRAQG